MFDVSRWDKKETSTTKKLQMFDVTRIFQPIVRFQVLDI